jgi:hypothetical protein
MVAAGKCPDAVKNNHSWTKKVLEKAALEHLLKSFFVPPFFCLHGTSTLGHLPELVLFKSHSIPNATDAMTITLFVTETEDTNIKGEYETGPCFGRIVLRG